MQPNPTDKAPSPARWMAVVAAIVSLAAPVGQAAAEERIGGPCTYTSHPGHCTITSIAKSAASKHQASVSGGPGYEGFEVKFSFKGDGAASPAAPGPYPLIVGSGTYPGPRYLEKYGIAFGKSFACSLEVRTQGACPPRLVKFRNIDQYDHFESAK